MAPVAYVGKQTSSLITTLDLLEIADLFYEYFNDFLYLPSISNIAVPVLHALPRMVWNIVEWIVGFDAEYHIDLAYMPMMARNDVGGTSTKNLMHWIQNVRTDKFSYFDYGEDGN